MEELSPSESASKRGVYRKKKDRAAAENMQCAWTIGDRNSFYAARARAIRAILGDLNLTGHDKAVLGVAIDHMNPDERWSCYASIELMAQESGVSASTCWRAIGKADGKHILTKRNKRRAGSQYASTHITLHPITLHPNYIAELRPSSPQPQDNVADLQKLDRNPAKTRSQTCEENSYSVTLAQESKKDIKDRVVRTEVVQEGKIGRDSLDPLAQPNLTAPDKTNSVSRTTGGATENFVDYGEAGRLMLGGSLKIIPKWGDKSRL
jgi:hypothetical protein